MYPASFAEPWPWFSQEIPSRKVAMGHSGAISLNFPSCKLRSNSPAINFKAARRTRVLVTSPPYPQRSSLFAVSVWLFNFPCDIWCVGSVPAATQSGSLWGRRQQRAFDIWLNKWLQSFRKCPCESSCPFLMGLRDREAVHFHLDTFALCGAQAGSLTQGTHTAPENEDVAADTPVSEAWGLPPQLGGKCDWKPWPWRFWLKNPTRVTGAIQSWVGSMCEAPASLSGLFPALCTGCPQGGFTMKTSIPGVFSAVHVVTEAKGP